MHYEIFNTKCAAFVQVKKGEKKKCLHNVMNGNEFFNS